MGKIKLLLGASILLLVSGQVNAVIISTPLQIETYSLFNDALNPIVSAPLEFDQFDSTLGNLLSVTVVADYEGIMMASIIGTHDPLGPFNQLHRAQIYSTFSANDISLGLNQAGSQALNPQLGCETFGDGRSTCTSEVIHPNINNTGVVFSVTDLPYLAAWIGTGTVTVSPTAEWSFLEDVSDPGTTADNGSFANWLETFVSVEYTYDDSPPISPVPAPAAIWLFGTGLIGLIGFSQRRKAA